MQSSSNDKWLSLSGAAEILGVHPGTVRAWSNKGIIPVHRTQGRHRRYLRSEVELWLEHARQPMTIEASTVLQAVLRQIRVHITEASLEAESWYRKLDDDARLQYRLGGSRLIQGLQSYLCSKGTQAESETYSIGYEYASRAHRYGLDIVDATRACLFFRGMLIESVVEVYQQANIHSGNSWQEMLHRIHHFTDEILISLLQTYQSLQDTSH
jgi:excisionase family DNA binding protein